MKRNCNLELQLLPSPVFGHHHSLMEGRIEGEGTNESPQQQQGLTIFYNGRVCVCDVTEIQARSIIMLASRDGEERMDSPSGVDRSVSPSLPSQLYSPSATGLSMKKSLQRFLQKRRNRIQATSPYNHQ